MPAENIPWSAPSTRCRCALQLFPKTANNTLLSLCLFLYISRFLASIYACWFVCIIQHICPLECLVVESQVPVIKASLPAVRAFFFLPNLIKVGAHVVSAAIQTDQSLIDHIVCLLACRRTGLGWLLILWNGVQLAHSFCVAWTTSRPCWMTR